MQNRRGGRDGGVEGGEAGGSDNAEVGVGLRDGVDDGDGAALVGGDAHAADVIEDVERPLGSGQAHADGEIGAVDDLAALVGRAARNRREHQRAKPQEREEIQPILALEPGDQQADDISHHQVLHSL